MLFNTYTPHRISTKNQFPKKPGFPLSVLTILVWYPYVSLVPDLLCNIGLSVSSLRKIRFNAYTPRRISTKKSVPKETRIPVVHVNNLRLVFLRFSVPWFIVQYRFEYQRFTQNTFLRLYTPSNFHKKNQFANKPGMHYMVAHHIVVQHKLNEHCAQRLWAINTSQNYFFTVLISPLVSQLVLFRTY